MAYQKHVWATGIPNRKKFEEMDEAIEKVAPANDGTNGQVLTKTSTGAKWQNASGGTAGDVTYDSSVTYPNGTVGKEITSLSEKIVKKVIIDTTEERVVGDYIYMDGDIKKSKPIYQKTYNVTLSSENTDISITNLDKVINGFGTIDKTTFSRYIGLGSYGNNVASIAYSDNTGVSIYASTSRYGDAIVTLQYTKTTDTPTPV